MTFIPLHLRSTYSFLRSGFSMKKIVKMMMKNNLKSLGLCDISVMHGIPVFNNALKDYGFNPILGMEIDVDNLNFSFFISEEDGYQNLLKIHELYKLKKLKLSDLTSLSTGLFVILEGNETFLENIKNTNFLKTLAIISTKAKGFFIGIAIYDERDELIASEVRKFKDVHNYKTIAFPLILYETSEDAITLEILNAIRNDEKLTIKEKRGPYHLPNEENLKRYTEEEINSTADIANSINFELNIKRGELFHTSKFDSSKSADEKLKSLCLDGLKNKYLFKDKNEYIERLNYELSVINQMGYSDYFLLVSDYVNFAKKNNIIVGSGRGSAVGSLVSYLTNITDVDPLKYDLLFERFLNPDRKSMPDIDIDFADVHREEVINYVKNRCGEDHVAHIATFQTIGAKQALRDIGRVYDIDTRIIDTLSKLIIDPRWNLGDAYRKNEKFKHYVDNDPIYFDVVRLANKIEGLVRQSSLHASGIIINDEPLDKILPIMHDEHVGYVSEYEMGALERQGFLKMDFLGITNLTTINEILSLLKERENILLTFDEIPYDDIASIELIKNNLTMGIFQLEQSSMKQAIQKIKPSTFNDVVDVLALGRPGPKNEIERYVRRKKGIEKITYLDECLEPVLRSTYGILIYQEQIIQIVRIYAGLSLGQADSFRRAISKKKPAELIALEKMFLDGAKRNGRDENQAKTIFNLIKDFAGYGFNKSHSVAYAMIATKMAYLKKHYPLYFYSAILDSKGAEAESKFLNYLQELKEIHIPLKNPNVNFSTSRFLAVDDGLLFPLSAIKGINTKVSTSIIQEREANGKYLDVYDFFKRIHSYKLDKKEYLSLIDGGALDCFNINRETLRDNNNLDDLIRYGDVASAEEGGFLPLEPPLLENIAPDDGETLSRELETLGAVISGKFLTSLKRDESYRHLISLEELKNDGKEHEVIALISAKKIIKTKRDETMAFVTLIDDTMKMDGVLFPETFNKYQLLLKKDMLVIIKGKLDHKGSLIILEMKAGK